MNELPLNQILCGDCVEVLGDFPDDSIDLVVTDPPYGLSFMGKDWDKTLPPREAFDEIIRVLKPGALSFVMSSPRQDLLWRVLAMLEGVGFELTQSYIDWIYKTGFPKAYDVSKGIDRKLGHERKVTGKGRSGDPKTHLKSLNMANDLLNGGYEFGGEYQLTDPSSDLAQKWSGWKSQTGLKPAHEPILMVNKPFSESTIVDNVLEWGTGAINVDSCRIPFQNEEERISTPSRLGFNQNLNDDGWKGIGKEIETDLSNKGRFPANLLVSDKAIDTGEITKSPSSYIRQTRSENIHAYGKGIGEPEGKLSLNYGDIGGDSRYFDLDAWAKHHGFLDVPKPDNSERDFGLKGKKRIPKSKFNLNDGSKDKRFDGVIPTPRRNTHPTVKPIKLMAYLIELGCPPDGVVLDPFVGSGTTCIAAKQLVRKFIGIEINPEYHALAESRVKAYPVPLSWFAETETQDVLVPPKARCEE